MAGGEGPELSPDAVEWLREANLTEARLRELLEGVRAEADVYDLLESSFLGELVLALTSPAVRALVRRYGAELVVEGGARRPWRLVVASPARLAIWAEAGEDLGVHYRAAALAGGEELASARGRDVEGALASLCRRLRGLAAEAGREEELAAWLASAWPRARMQRPSRGLARGRREAVELAAAISEALGPGGCGSDYSE